MPSFRQCAPIIIVAVLLICEIYCTNVANPTIQQSTTVSNVWIRRQNSTVNKNPDWQGPPTTPWPSLGAPKPRNQKPSENNPNQNQNSGSGISNNVQFISSQNRNIGFELSYGRNSAGSQNINNVRAGSSGNTGIDLSYGLNTNQNNKNLGGATISNQNLDYAKVTQNNQNSYQNMKPSNFNQNSVKSNQNMQVTQKPVLQPVNPVTTVTNTINSVKSPNTVPGSVFQTGNKTTSVILSEDDQLREFSEVLLRKDVNSPAKYVTINYQGKTTSRSMNDEAPLPLLTIQKEAYSIPSIANLLQLHNNYILETNANEHVSAQERMEENALLDTLLSTPIMQHTRNFLVEKGAIPKDPKVFREKLKEIWFNMYSRGQGKIGSSGFEHVFLAELKNNDVSGLHNWLYFHDAEAKKAANYLGYLKKFEFGNKGAILKYHFTFTGVDKPVGSMFIGTSPEFEIALYTTCFLLRADQVCPLKLGGKNFIIRTYTFRYRGKNMIGSAFPEI